MYAQGGYDISEQYPGFEPAWADCYAESYEMFSSYEEAENEA